MCILLRITKADLLWYNDCSIFTDWTRIGTPVVRKNTTNCPSYWDCFRLKSEDGLDGVWRSTINTIGYYDISIQFLVKTSSGELEDGPCNFYVKNDLTDQWVLMWSEIGKINNITVNINNLTKIIW